MKIPSPDPFAPKNTWVQAEVRATHLRGKFWRIECKLVYYDHRGRRWEVPVNFVTDFASVPWPFTLFIPRSGKHNPAAALHDLLYLSQALPRRECDIIFIGAMSALGVFPPKAKVMYLAVRIGGWLPWVLRSLNIMPEHDRPFANYYQP